MADKMQFDLVSPERPLASMEVRAVRLPGAEGDMTAMPDHAPLITTLRPGVLTAEVDGGTEDYFVSGGFAQISSEGVAVLAESALPKGEVTSDWLDALFAEAREAQERAQGDAVDAAAKVVADLVAAGDQIGISVSSRAPAP